MDVLIRQQYGGWRGELGDTKTGDYVRGTLSEIELKQFKDLVPESRVHQPTYPGPKFRSNVINGYHKNELVAAGINAIAQATSRAPITVTDFDTKNRGIFDDHMALDILRRPSLEGYLTYRELIRSIVVFRHLGGNAFIEKVRSLGGKGKPVELIPHSPERVRIYFDRSKVIRKYTVEIEGQERDIRTENMIHIKYWSPLDDFIGMPSVIAALRRISTDNELTDHTKVTLENHGVPPVVIETEYARLVDDLIKSLKEWWRRAMKKSNRGEPLFTSKGMKVKTIGQSLQELVMPDLAMNNEVRILMVLGVPPIVVNAATGMEHAIYNNFREARQMFHEGAVEEEWGTITDKLTVSLLPDFGTAASRLQYSFVTTGLPAYTDKEMEEAMQVRKDYRADIITREEARMMRGLPTVPTEGEFRDDGGENEDDDSEQGTDSDSPEKQDGSETENDDDES